MRTWNVTYTAGNKTRKGLVRLPASVAPGSATLGQKLKVQHPGQVIQVKRWTPFPTV